MAANLMLTFVLYSVGLVCFAFYHQQTPAVDPVTTELDGNADRIFPYFVLNVLPNGEPILLGLS
jgi:hypothetical protein